MEDTPQWIALLLSHESSSTSFLQILSCFPRKSSEPADVTTQLPTQPPTADELISHAIESMLPHLGEEIVTVLSKEIDTPQSEMFSRRFGSVATLLLQQGSKVLAAGLIIRTWEILKSSSTGK